MYIYWTIRDSRVMETAPPQRWMDRALCPPDGDSAKGEEKEKKIAIFSLKKKTENAKPIQSICSSYPVRAFLLHRGES